MSTLRIALEDPNGYKVEITMGLMDSIGSLKENLRKRTGKAFTSEEITFNGDPISPDDETKIVDQFFHILSFIMRSNQSDAATPFGDTTIILNAGDDLAALVAEAGSGVDTPKSLAVLFPGQGTQQVGMGSALFDTPGVKEVFDTASKVLGYDMMDLCKNGPKEKLDDTMYSQPAIMTVSVAATVKMQRDDPEILAKCGYTAGFSLGEYSALVFSGALSFEDALKVVKVRATAMNAATESGPKGGMVTITGMEDAKLEALCAEAKAKFPDSVCQVANYLFPGGRVVACDNSVADWLVENATAQGAMRAKRLLVSGAFHSPRMQAAKTALQEVLANVQINEPNFKVYSNVTGKAYSNAEEIRSLLAEQMVSGVQWETSMKNMMADDAPKEYVETGPGKQLKAMLRKIDQDAFKACAVIATIKD
jgi:[acyl-carrier-protein] S-malonyltransferase